MSIIDMSGLNDYYFSGNLPHILYETSKKETVTITIAIEARPDTVIVEEHEPIGHGIIINIRDLLHNELYLDYNPLGWIGQTLYKQPTAVAEVTVAIQGDMAKTFTVIKGNTVAEQAFIDGPTFFRANLLNAGPQIRYIKAAEPVFINYFASPGIMTIVIQGKRKNQTLTFEETYDSRETANELFTADITWQKVMAAVFQNETDIEYFEVWVQFYEMLSPGPPPVYAGRLSGTHKLRFVLCEKHNQYSDFFLFENSIGGLETIHFTGQKSEEVKHEYIRAKRLTTQGPSEDEYAVIPLTVYHKNTGWITNPDQQQHTLDFFAGTRRYHWNNDRFVRMYLIEHQSRITPGQLNSIEFSYAYNRQFTGRIPSRDII